MSTSYNYQYLLRQTEYHGTQKALHQDQNFLDGLGEDGWDLAAAVPIVEDGKTVRIVFCLKKQSRGSYI
jgi:hypothetical protein